MTVNEKTKVSLYTIGCCLPFLVSTILWLATINQKAEAAQAINMDQERRLDKHERSMEDQMHLLIDIRERIVRIETQIKNLK